MNPSRKTFCAAALFAALILSLHAPTLLSRRNFGGRDLTVYNLPMEKSVHDAWARGRVPVWSDHISGGRPLLPNPNAGALYPVRALLSLVPFAEAIRLFPVLHWAASGVGIILLLRALHVSPAAAFVGAAAYVFSGVGMGNVFFPHTHPGITLLPWIVWALVAPKRPAARVAMLAVLFALDFLAADVFTSGLAVGAAVLWIWLENPSQMRRPLAVALLAGVLLGLAAALPQIVATALWIPQTSRAVQGLKLGEAFLFSIRPVRLLELVVPYPFGPTWELDPPRVWAPAVFRGKTVGLFPTLSCGAFAVIAAAHSRRPHPRGSRFAFAMVLLGVLLAVPPGLLPAGWADAPSPVALRNPEKMAVAIALGLSLLAGLGFDPLRSNRRAGRGVLAIGAVLALAALASRLTPRIAEAAAGSPQLRETARAGFPAALAEAGLLWMLAYAGVRVLPSRPGPAAAAVLFSAVPILGTLRIAQTFPQEEILAPTAFARFVSKQDPGGSYRVLGESLYRPDSALSLSLIGADRGQVEFGRGEWVRDTPVLWGRGMVLNGDFDAGDLSRTESLRRLSSVLVAGGHSAALFGSLALRWGIRFRDQEPLPGYERIGGNALQSWDELAPAERDIRLLRRWTETPGPAEALRALTGRPPPAAVIESRRFASGTADDGEATILERTPERLVIQTRSSSPTWLFVLRGLWKYRCVRVDGREVGCAPAQLAFTAVPVPAGAHRVEWKEQVPGGRASWIGPVLFAIGLATLWTRSRRE